MKQYRPKTFLVSMFSQVMDILVVSGLSVVFFFLKIFQVKEDDTVLLSYDEIKR